MIDNFSRVVGKVENVTVPRASDHLWRGCRIVGNNGDVFVVTAIDGPTITVRPTLRTRVRGWWRRVRGWFRRKPPGDDFVFREPLQ